MVSTRDLLVILFTIQIICIGWAASTPGSTLSNAFTLTIVTLVRYGVLFVSPFLLFSNKINFDLKNIGLCLIPLSYYLFCVINIYDPTLTPSIIWLLLALEFMLCSDDIKLDIFYYFKRFLVITSSLGIVFFLASVISLPIPHTIVDYYDVTGIPTKYVNYYISYVVSQGSLYRLCGIFNEPGYLGTVLAFVLIVDNINIKKRENIILFIAGCCTFSMAFFVLLLIFLALISYKKKWPVIILVLIILLYYVALPSIAASNSALGTLLQRFTFVDGLFSGDNRSTILLNSTFDRIMSGTEKYFGQGYGYWAAVRTWGTSSYKSYFVDFGIVGFVVMYGLYLLSAIRKGKGNLFSYFFITCFFLSIYQRPNIFNLMNYLLLFGGIEYQIEFNKEEYFSKAHWRFGRV